MSGQDDVLASTEMHLRERPSRTPDHQIENRALSRLAREMARRPGNVLHTLCDQVLDICDAESAGVSLLADDGAGDFVWPAVAGAWASYTGGGMPRDASPCGIVIERDASLLFHEVERSFPAVAHASPRIREILLAPFHIDDRPIGTVWAIMHSNRRQFDREDRRLLESIAEFAAAAYQLSREGERRAEGERRQAALAAELRERGQFLSSVLAASTDCIKVLDLDGRLTFMSEGGLRAMEISDFNDVKGFPWPDFLKNDGSSAAHRAIEAARQGETTHFEATTEAASGDLRHWSVSVSPITGADGTVERILSVSRDHTALQTSREEQRLLNGELAHRIKNLMSVVQAIAYQTLSRSADAAAVQAFEDRMTALSRSHDMLTGRSWASAELGDLVRLALATFGGDRFELDGPDVAIGSRAALALSLMLHELATNAVKYGSLSVPDGKVAVDWRLRADDDGPVLVFHWTERGGPPAIEPTWKGFGSRIIHMGLTGSGSVNLTYGTQGLTVEASAPLYQLQDA